MLPLRSLALRRRRAQQAERFPYSIPAVRLLETLDFPTPVTFFVGENGSGKSTLLEAIAHATGLPAIGSELRVEDDEGVRRRVRAVLPRLRSRVQEARGASRAVQGLHGGVRALREGLRRGDGIAPACA